MVIDSILYMLTFVGFRFLRDFPQCCDTEDAILELLEGKLGLNPKYTTAFKDEHSKRVLEHPGRAGFRMGISLSVLFELSEDKLTFFVSIPYFGMVGPAVTLDSTSESVTLSELKQLKVHIPNNGGLAGEEERDEIGEILVDQARYMVFDDRKLHVFLPAVY
ncbi:hypothetical protein L873DRAFT_275013 [Choiromyces venosus 120613-1]|uniref:Uncharacterized protein n=1 Tax=Choiromyces venosus 120613-1 TaxID=1336337 RepID=A0A3N4JXH1_9PEZI|nr:hypothetical protein L873DRAFT_275013 [Choiromyces venosus 120613-1]